MDRPREQYAPDELDVALMRECILEPVNDRDATIVTNNVQNQSVLVKLTDIFILDETTIAISQSDSRARMFRPRACAN
jgi:hypothetical protein